MLGMSNETTIATVVITESSAHDARTALTAFSPYRGLDAERDRGGLSAPVPPVVSIASWIDTSDALGFHSAIDHLLSSRTYPINLSRSAFDLLT